MNAKVQSGARVFIVLALVGLVTTLAGSKLDIPATGIDDANIFFVYARHFSAGHGFVFNPDGERVEGFTSLLWVLAASAATTVGGSPERVLLVFNILLVTLTLVCCVRALSGAWAVALLILLLSDPAYVTWHTVALMETALWGALLTIAVLVACEQRDGNAPWLGAIGVLLVLTRPEALLWVPTLLVLVYLTHATATRLSAGAKLVLPGLAGFALAAGALTIFRLVYFGSPLPNTYYAKVSPSITYSVREGATYLVSYAASSPIVFTAVLAVPISVLHAIMTRFRERKTLVLAGAAATGLGIPILTGGDHFDGFRFYQPIYPVLLLNLAHCLRTVAPQYLPASVTSAVDPRLKLVATAAGLGMCIVFQAVAWISADRSALLGREFDIAVAGRQAGERANLVFAGMDEPPDIAAITVGGIQYAYRGAVIDLMGLNNTRMAHNGGDRVGVRSHAAFELRTFDDLNPKIVLPLVQYSDSMSAVGRPDPFAHRVLKGLLERQDFRGRYQLAEVRTKDGISFAGWYQRRFLSHLRRAGELDVVVADRDY
jgi:hypothetical protein